MNLSFYFIKAGPFPVPLKSNIHLLTSASAFISYCPPYVKPSAILKYIL